MSLRLAILGLDPIQRDWLDAVSALAGTGEIELHGPGFGGQHGIEVLGERRMGKLEGQKAKLQHVVTIVHCG